MLIKEECNRFADGFEEEGNTDRWIWKDDRFDGIVLEEDSDDFLKIDFGCKLEHVNGIFEEVESFDERWKDDVLDMLIKEEGTEDNLKWEENTLDFL